MFCNISGCVTKQGLLHCVVHFFSFFSPLLTRFNKAHQALPSARFPSVIWDVLPKCGASQVHPHLQGFLDPERYHGVELLVQSLSLSLSLSHTCACTPSNGAMALLNKISVFSHTHTYNTGGGGVIDTCAWHAGLFHDVTDTGCWTHKMAMLRATFLLTWKWKPSCCGQGHAWKWKPSCCGQGHAWKWKPSCCGLGHAWKWKPSCCGQGHAWKWKPSCCGQGHAWKWKPSCCGQRCAWKLNLLAVLTGMAGNETFSLRSLMRL